MPDAHRVLPKGLPCLYLTMLYLMAKGTSLLENGYKGMLESLPEEKQSELIVKKAGFAKIAEIYM